MKHFNIHLLGAILTIATGTGITSANAANLVQNGGFETGDFTGFTVSTAKANSVQASGFNGTQAASGSYFAALGDASNTYPFGTISQIVSTTVGQVYTFSYDLLSDGKTPNYFDASFNDITFPTSIVTDVPDQRSNGYIHYSFKVTGTGSDKILFHEQNRPNYLALDNVSLTAATPEPATWAILIFGLGAVGMRLRSAKRRDNQLALTAA